MRLIYKQFPVKSFEIKQHFHKGLQIESTAWSSSSLGCWKTACIKACGTNPDKRDDNHKINNSWTNRVEGFSKETRGNTIQRGVIRVH